VIIRVREQLGLGLATELQQLTAGGTYEIALTFKESRSIAYCSSLVVQRSHHASMRLNIISSLSDRGVVTREGPREGPEVTGVSVAHD